MSKQAVFLSELCVEFEISSVFGDYFSSLLVLCMETSQLHFYMFPFA